MSRMILFWVFVAVMGLATVAVLVVMAVNMFRAVAWAIRENRRNGHWL